MMLRTSMVSRACIPELWRSKAICSYLEFEASFIHMIPCVKQAIGKAA